MPGFGVLVLIFLFGFALFGVAVNGKPVVTEYQTTSLQSFTVIDEAQDGGTLELSQTEDAHLSLRHRPTRPHVSGNAVKLVPLDRGGLPRISPYPASQRVDEWKIVRVARGTATITTTSGPAFRFT